MKPPAIWPKLEFEWSSICDRKCVAAFSRAVGGESNAFYGYDVRKTLPFDASRPVGTTVNAPNSLKHKHRMLWMRHQDNIKGWNKWEDMFEATLKENFDIRPNAAPKRAGSRVAAPATALVPPQIPPPVPPPTRAASTPTPATPLAGRTTGRCR